MYRRAARAPSSACKADRAENIRPRPGFLVREGDRVSAVLRSQWEPEVTQSRCPSPAIESQFSHVAVARVAVPRGYNHCASETPADGTFESTEGVIITSDDRPDAANPPPDKQLLEAFLWAPRFRQSASPHFPRLHDRLSRIRWQIGKRIGNLLFERGLETTGHVSSIEHFHPDRVWYEASGWSYLRRALPRKEVDRKDVFVDFGSGKGRIVYQAALYPFSRVIGVEISPELAGIARQNLERNRDKLACQHVEIVTADVTTFEIPDDMTVAYFYYPFVGETFHRVIDNIVGSLDRRPRRVRLVYALPTMEEYILGTGRFRLRRSVRIVDMGLPHRIGVYESVASANELPAVARAPNA